MSDGSTLGFIATRNMVGEWILWIATGRVSLQSQDTPLILRILRLKSQPLVYVSSRTKGEKKPL